jgi:hypothetical protein
MILVMLQVTIVTKLQLNLFLEYCSGSSTTCPTNAFASSSTVCRASNGDCDIIGNALLLIPYDDNLFRKVYWIIN